jgi:hypothetical protein
MGITPITNLMPLPVARLVQGEMDPLPMERIQSSSRTGDETYSPSGGKSARGSEDDAFEDAPETSDDESADGQTAQPSQAAVPRKISFFA